MCSPMRCSTCQKTTWSGCGMHAEEVLSRVPVEQRCDCGSLEQKVQGLPGLSFRR